VYALLAGTAGSQTINLAFGQGNTLVRAAELIAQELGVEPDVTIAPSLVGEVTHYIADVRKAHDVLGWTPQTSLEDGIPKAVQWFREWRAEHAEEDRAFERPGSADELAHGFKQPAGTGA
jgi:UDP-glucose 4-epimerase